MSEPVRPRSAANRPPLGDATYRINNNLTQAAGKHGKSQDAEALSTRSVTVVSADDDEADELHHLPESEPRIHDSSYAAAPQQYAPVQPRHPRTKAVQEADSSKRASQASQASTAPSSNRSSGYNYKTQVGPWQLGKTLGKGSSARVRLCRHRLSGELAAVKIIPKKTAYLIQHGSLAALHKYDDSLPDRIDGEMRVPMSIEREVAILKLVDHPNVMKVYDIWENRSEIYLVLEYVDQGDLFDYINSNGRLTEEDAMYYFRQIMSAMQYCHTFNICHRDLKPENILLNSQSQVKIADFGMAALHQSEGHRLETACGSPHYAAPELLKNRAYRGDLADIWSLGVILYAILAASLPFDDPDIRTLLAKTKRGQYEMPEFLSLEAKDLIRRMLQVNPEVRIDLKDMWRHPLIARYDYLDDLSGRGGESCNIRNGFHYAPLRSEEVDTHLVRQLRSLWHKLSEQQIKQKLMDLSKNDLKLFYWLLQNYRQKQLENFLPEVSQSPSDYHHLHQPVWRRRVSTCEFNQPRVKGPGRSISKFTVISHVPDTESGTIESYDPYNADHPMRGNSQVSHAKVTVHRKNQGGKSPGRNDPLSTQLPRNATRSTVHHGRKGSQWTATTARSGRLNSMSSPRNSMSSFASSRQGTPYARSASRKKRGIDFSQVRKPSIDQRNQVKRSSDAGRMMVQGEGVPYAKANRAAIVPGSPPTLRPIMDRPKPRLKIVKHPDPAVLVNEEVRHFSNSIAKDCDEAFNSSMIDSNISEPAREERAADKRDSTPYSFSTRTPSLTSPTAPSSNHSWDNRPLPPLPSERPESPELMDIDTEESAPDLEDASSIRMSKFVGRIAKPVLLPKHERRVVSAPAHTQDGKGHEHLPSISENSPDFGAAEPDRARIVSAPPKTPRGQADADGLDCLSRMGNTIRVVNSPSATSPVPKPLNVRKKHPEKAADANTSNPRQAYMHGAISEDTTEDSATSSLQPTTAARKKKTSWFRRQSKDSRGGTSVRSEDTQWTGRTENTWPATVTSGSTAPSGPQTPTSQAEMPLPVPERKKSFGFLFWKNNKKSDGRMSLAGPAHEDSPPPEEIGHVAGRKRSQQSQPSLPESDSGVRKIEVHQNWLARLFGVKPATSHLCMTISRRAARQEIVFLLREWRRYGIRDVQVDKERNIVFARVGAKNYLNIKEVAFAMEIMTVIEHGRRGSLSIIRFTQERGAASSFHRVVDTMWTVLGARQLLVTDKRKEKMMIKTLNS